MFLVVALLLFIVPPSPWNVIGGLASGAHPRSRVLAAPHAATEGSDRRREFIGATGEVTDLLAPSGHARARGFRVVHALPRGSRVRVVALHGLALAEFGLGVLGLR
jgi:hypothetical protein